MFKCAGVIRDRSVVLQSTAAIKHGSKYSAQENHQKHVAWSKGLNEGKHFGIARYGIAAKDFASPQTNEIANQKIKAQEAAARKKDKAEAAAVDKAEREKRSKSAREENQAREKQEAQVAAGKQKSAAEVAKSKEGAPAGSGTEKHHVSTPAAVNPQQQKSPSAEPTKVYYTEPTKAPYTEPTKTPTTVPTKALTKAPTFHSCTDGSHGCDKQSGGVCNAVGDGWECGCAAGYICVDGCESPHVGHKCKATKAPTKAPTKTPTKAPTKAPTKTPTTTPIVAGGCAACDLVPCGWCQQGCPLSSCRDESPGDKPGKSDRNGCATKNGILNFKEVPPKGKCRTSCGSSCDTPQSLCYSTGDPHLRSLKGKTFNTQEFDFQEVGEFKFLESATDHIKAHVYQFPWSDKDAFYSGAVSNIGVAVTLGEHAIEITDTQVTIDGKELTESRTTFSDGVQVVVLSTNPKQYVLSGPSSTEGYANLKITRQSVAKSLFAPGYYYNIYARIPFDHTVSSSGLCRALASGSTRVGFGSSKFSTGWRNSVLNKYWKDSGADMSKFESVDGAAKACTKNGISLAASKAACADVGTTQFDACVYDFCLTGDQKLVADAKVAVLDVEKEMEASNEPSVIAGCGTCDLVPCGYCQEGCSVSSCKQESEVDKPGKSDRNGCAMKNGIPNFEQVPPKGKCRPNLK